MYGVRVPVLHRQFAGDAGKLESRAIWGGEGKVATDGWSKMTGHDVVDLAKKFEDYGVEAVIYTDIGRDGMLTGVNIEGTVRLARELKIPVIASGGINSIKDIQELAAFESEGVTGAIAGRALYEGTLDFAAALKAAKGR